MCMYVRICMSVRVNLENGWKDFDFKKLNKHYGYRRTHGLHGLSKNGLETTEKLENVL